MSDASQEARLAGFRVGDVLVGRFRIIGAIGEGGTAEVYRAVDLESESPVALKLMRTSIADDPEALERMRREGEILERLSHPAIVAIVALGAIGDGRLFIAMELLEGETLGARLRRGPATAAELAPVIAGVGAGLMAAHELGIVHRDMKPDNIFLTRASDGTMGVKLLDFGVSKMMDMERLTQTGQVIGTPRYMAPEQLTAERDLDGRVDVYAVGVILYEALSGRPAFDARTPSDLIVAILQGSIKPLEETCTDLPAELVAIVSRAMSREANARFESVAELADAFIGALGSAEPSSRTRRGVSTSVMGGMDGPLVTPASDEELRPGTFSELEAVAKTRRSAPIERPAFSTPAAEPTTPPSRENAPRPAEVDAQVGSEDETLDELPLLPVRGGWALRVLLIAIALAAGGVTAAAVIAALREDASAAPPPASSAAPVEPEGAALPSVEPPPAPEPEERPEEVAPTPEATLTVANPEVSRQPTSRRRRRRAAREASAMQAASPTMDPEPETPAPTEPAEDSPAALIRSARAAMRSGDAAQCVELLDRALASGAPSFALRMRADCLMRVGRESEALRSYQRFCRIAPDHPAISEVRAIVDGLGGRCD